MYSYLLWIVDVDHTISYTTTRYDHQLWAIQNWQCLIVCVCVCVRGRGGREGNGGGAWGGEASNTYFSLLSTSLIQL